MGMYTELIFGCQLKKETPKKIIDDFINVLSENYVYNDNVKFEFENLWILRSASYYFGVSKSVSKIWYE